MGEVVNVLVAVAVVVLVVRWATSGTRLIAPLIVAGLTRTRSISCPPIYDRGVVCICGAILRGQGQPRCAVAVYRTGLQAEECHPRNGAFTPAPTLCIHA